MNPKVCYCTERKPLIVPILSQLNQVHTLIVYRFKVYFNIIHPSKSPKWFLSIGLLEENLNAISFPMIRPRPTRCVTSGTRACQTVPYTKRIEAEFVVVCVKVVGSTETRVKPQKR
jgi:hypothetical protein